MAERTDAFARCHPAVNLVYFLPVFVFAMILIHPAYIAVSLAGSIAYYLLIAGRKGVKRVIGMLPVPVVVTLINPLFNTYGKTVLFELFHRPYTLEALYYGAAIGTVFYAVLLWFMCWGTVMTNDRFTCLFGNMVPAISLLLVMVFRLVPAYRRKAAQISGARGCIGHGAGSGTGKKEKIRAGMEVLTAMTGWALESSVQTADSMRSRGYGTSKRTSFQIYSLSAQDRLIGIVVILAAVITGVCAGMGCAQASYTPEFYITPVGSGTGIIGLIAYALMIAVPIILDIREEIIWRYSISKL